MKEKPIPDARIIPVEKIIDKDGIHTIIEVQGKTKEDVDATVAKLDSMGMGNYRLTETKKIDHSHRQTFGFPDWGNCKWNPPGPKRNWAVPEDPSKN